MRKIRPKTPRKLGYYLQYIGGSAISASSEDYSPGHDPVSTPLGCLVKDQNFLRAMAFCIDNEAVYFASVVRRVGFWICRDAREFAPAPAVLHHSAVSQ
jgi:hypothetical protein